MRVVVHTPKTEVDYHNDCLHPCIRKWGTNKYIMVQSPWYDFNDSIENPLLYISSDAHQWKRGVEISKTPEMGYNSDPNVFVEDGTIYVLWREYGTPKCGELNCVTALFYRYSVDGGRNFSDTYMLLKTMVFDDDYDVEDFSVETLMCPILIKHNDKYIIYATWYQFEPAKKNLGIAIWEGTSLLRPNFELKHLVPIKPIWTVDKWHQLPIGGHLFFCPVPHKYDLWHFDLFEYNDKLYMLSCEDKADNIMLGVSDDYIHFKTCRSPLLNAHYMENRVHYRQKYYKPTAYIEGDILHLFYTSNAQNDYRQNVLWTVDIDFLHAELEKI